MMLMRGWLPEFRLRPLPLMAPPVLVLAAVVPVILMVPVMLGCEGKPATDPLKSEPATVPVASVTTSAPATVAVPPPQANRDGAEAAAIWLVDVSAEVSVDGLHTVGNSGRHYIPEGVAAGLALFDYDGDGRTDIYLLNGAPLPPLSPDPTITNRLYRNEGGFRFRDVTVEAGVGHPGFAMGVVAADYDNDGHADLFVTNFGGNVFYRNNGDGTFSDLTAVAGVAGSGRVGAGASFVDIDNDGWLDLYAASYVDFSPDKNVERLIDGEKVYPSPLDYDPVPDTLWRNSGDGTFHDVSSESGIAASVGRGMAVISADYDNDGDSDIFVMNDASANFLFENDGRGHFEEVAVIRGVAFNGDGRAQGNMGVDSIDYDRDGRLDFYVTTFSTEPPVLYRNAGAYFDDATLTANASAGLVPHIKWGTGFADFDNDSLPDLFVATGDFNAGIERWWPATSLKIKNVVLRNIGRGRFENVSATAGSGLEVVESSRGIGLDDLDGDGRVDVVVLNWQGRPTVIRNESPGDLGWLEVRLIGSQANRDGVGAQVRVTAAGATQLAEVHAGRGYQSHFGQRLHFGLGNTHEADSIEVRWPGGGFQTLEHVRGDRVVTIRQEIGQQEIGQQEAGQQEAGQKTGLAE